MLTKLTNISCLVIYLLMFHSFCNAQEYQPPAPVGGDSQLEDFICYEMVYPEEALKENIKGKVTIRFTVTKDGRTENPVIVSSGSTDLDNEALRIFRKTLWNNAVKMGKPVDAQQQIKIKFNPRKYLKSCKKRGFKHFSYDTLNVDTTEKVYNLSDLEQPPTLDLKDEKNLSSFISKNLKYPEAAFKQNIAGKVRLDYVVEPHGGVSHIVVKEPLGGGCSQEAVRIVKLLKYKPGIKDNMAVRTNMTLSLTFQLHDRQGVQYVPNTPTSGY